MSKRRKSKLISNDVFDKLTDEDRFEFMKAEVLLNVQFRTPQNYRECVARATILERLRRDPGVLGKTIRYGG